MIRSRAHLVAILLGLAGTVGSSVALAAPGDEAKEKAAADSPSDDQLKHDPITEAPVGKPLPVSVSKASPAKKLVVYYLPPEADDWAKVKMKRAGKEWRALVPCSATAHPGTLQYYVVGEDEDGELVKHAGSKAHPFEVALKKKLSGEPPTFSGEEPPTSCDEVPDCTSDSEGSGLQGQGQGQGRLRERRASQRGGRRRPFQELADARPSRWISRMCREATSVRRATIPTRRMPASVNPTDDCTNQ